ncbi:thermonuclease family protein [Cohnella yongneupensis]|uniref:Thermonuclease family protein n=1 Tax=Cohnella yongneupensis TaxID=425006 RepID=A0ABW0R563_9BACL
MLAWKVAKRRTGLAAAILIATVFALGGCADKTQVIEEVVPDIDAIYDRYPELEGKQAEEAVVKRVVDGDTFETDGGDKVRLIGVNTPEKYGKVEYFGVEASAFSERMLKGKSIYLFKDVSETDRYGRLLRFVFIQGETTMYNETLLNEGYANVMTYAPDVTFAKKFLKLEQQARSGNVGLWNDGEAGAEPDKAEHTEASPADAPSCEQPLIKGNIKSGGKEKIYHVPGGSSYNATKAEVMFCTEEEAVAAGFRKAAR